MMSLAASIMDRSIKLSLRAFHLLIVYNVKCDHLHILYHNIPPPPSISIAHSSKSINLSQMNKKLTTPVVCNEYTRFISI